MVPLSECVEELSFTERWEFETLSWRKTLISFGDWTLIGSVSKIDVIVTDGMDTATASKAIVLSE